MKLRNLEPKDAPAMLEWMHDADVVADLKANFQEKTMDDCLRFIESAKNADEDIHFAAANDGDEYMGTVSLKHIDRQEGWAEFAIVVRKAAMGRGISREAMSRILSYGVQKLGLRAIYWCVSRHNARAVRFYDKNGYERTENVPMAIAQRYRQELPELIWYEYPGTR